MIQIQRKTTKIRDHEKDQITHTTNSTCLLELGVGAILMFIERELLRELINGRATGLFTELMATNRDSNRQKAVQKAAFSLLRLASR